MGDGSGDKAATGQVDEVKINTFRGGSIDWSRAQGSYRLFPSPSSLAVSCLSFLLSRYFSEERS